MVKKVIAIATTITLAAGLAVGIPARTQAEIPEGGVNPLGNTINVDAGEELTTNNGIVTENNGTINNNENSVHRNYGVINHNKKVVSANRGLINNESDPYRPATVGSNYIGGTVTGDGKVINNWGGTVAAGIEIENQLYRVSVDNIENGNATYASNGFRDLWIDDRTEKYVMVRDQNVDLPDHSGNITITADNNYQITNTRDTTSGAGTGYAYSLAENNGSYVVTISSVTQNIMITMQELGLLIEQIQQQNPNVPVVVRVDDSITITEDETRSSNQEQVQQTGTSNIILASQISAMIESALAVSPDTTVLDIDFGNDPSLTVDSLVALCEKNSVAKSCHFTHNGMKLVLFIPMIDPTSATYQQCKVLLDAEPGKQAGPIRLSQLFAPVGFALSQE